MEEVSKFDSTILCIVFSVINFIIIFPLFLLVSKIIFGSIDLSKVCNCISNYTPTLKDSIAKNCLIIITAIYGIFSTILSILGSPLIVRIYKIVPLYRQQFEKLKHPWVKIFFDIRGEFKVCYAKVTLSNGVIYLGNIRSVPDYKELFKNPQKDFYLDNPMKVVEGEAMTLAHGGILLNTKDVLSLELKPYPIQT